MSICSNFALNVYLFIVEDMFYSQVYMLRVKI